jgi:anti-anti-sigma regulatory factor
MSKMESKEKYKNRELSLLIETHQDVLTARLADNWAAYLHTSVQEVTPLVSTTLAQLIDALDSGVADRLVDPFAEWAGEQADKGLEAGVLLRLGHSLSWSLWDVIEDVREPTVRGRPQSNDGGGTVAWLHDLVDLVTLAQVAAVDALAAAYAAKQRQALSREQARTASLAQAQARLAQQVRELSSPVIKVWEEVLVLPLVGAIDSDRANRLMEDLLQGIVHHQAEIVIIDMTGVPEVDTNVVNHLMRTVKAASLLGAYSVLVGIRSEMAQTMIQLGVDLKGIETRRNLQSGVEFALQRLRLQVVPQDQGNIGYEVS